MNRVALQPWKPQLVETPALPFPLSSKSYVAPGPQACAQPTSLKELRRTKNPEELPCTCLTCSIGW